MKDGITQVEGWQIVIGWEAVTAPAIGTGFDEAPIDDFAHFKRFEVTFSIVLCWWWVITDEDTSGVKHTSDHRRA
jgi:hypothetical protein